MKFEIAKIKEKVRRTSLYIARIPDKAKTEFIALAEEEFEGDYGMLIKWLLDFRSGLLTNPNEDLMEQIEALSAEVAELKKGKAPGKRKIRSVSGKTIIEKEE